MSGDDLRALAEAATPGPWRWEPKSDESWPQGDESLVTGTEPSQTVLYGWGYDASGIDAEPQDRAFIAAANPTAVLALLDEVDRLRADIVAAEQRGREDNADHGMCYVSGSKALEAILDRAEAAERRAEMWQGLAEGAKAQLLKSPKQVAEEEADALRKQLGCDCGGVTFHKNCASRQYVITKREFDESKARAEAAEAAVGRVWALADEWVKRDCEWSCESEMLDDLRAALDGPQ